MNEIRRSLLWAVFGISLVMLWDQWQIHNGNAPLFFSQGASNKAASTAAAPASVGAAGAATNTVPAATAATQALPAAAAPAVQELVTVQSDVLNLTFDAMGGNLVGAQLLKHAADNGGKKGQTEPLTLLAQTPAHTYVVQSGLAGAMPNHITRMTPVVSAKQLTDGQDSLEVRFESDVVGGVQLVKTYTVKRADYTLDVRFDVLNTSDQTKTPELYVQLARDGMSAESETPFYQTFTGPAFYSDESKYQKVTFDDITKNDATFAATSTSGYVAMVQHYFASAWILPAGQARENYVAKFASGIYTAGSKAQLGELPAGATQTVQTRLFVGPQQETMLETVTPGLELVKDYGWVTILAKPLYWLLDKIHGFVGNWGWAIVLLVVLIKAAFYWLNAKAYQSMGKMKALSPRITEMRERLKDKPQQMQQEMMRIYREEKVNPLGGCLPIMIQIPVFIALYWVLLSSVEMRNAPWVLWISDLSTKDPYFILPVVMTMTTFIQTALNPTPPDALQAKLMWIMPMAFSVMFFFFPAGLVLYWITNNTLTILQQWHINKGMGVEMKFKLPSFK
jgi:YidC/Oxa1 family membrane protein insertase